MNQPPVPASATTAGRPLVEPKLADVERLFGRR
jgi:hypothetical protein